jgi:hypothetical protein
MPDVDNLVVLIRSAILALHQANATGNYAVLRGIAAPAFQQRNTPASLSTAFAGLRDRKLDLSQIAVVNPSLHRDPAIDNEGFLHLLGFFPVQGVQVNFDLAYQMVDGRWRLFGIGAFPAEGSPETKPPAPTKPGAKPAVPDDMTLIGLIRSTITALNQANAAGDYSVLRDLSAPGFQQGNSLARLGELFAALRERRIDLAPITVITPRLGRPAVIDPNGYLRITGFFPSSPEQVNFDLAFDLTSDGWRLFGIGLNTTRAGTPPPSAQNAEQPAPPAAAASAPQPPPPRPRPQKP